MKKLFIIALTLIASHLFSQSTSDIFDYKVMTFYGLDFTSAKCIGSSEFPGSDEMINLYFREWNDIFLNEDDRLRIGKPYKKKDVILDTMVYGFNSEISKDELIIDEAFSLKKSDIDDIALKYANNDHPGIGMIYIVEALNADAEYLSVWITFIQNSTGEVLLTEPLRSKGKGKRFEDYWFKAFYKLFIESAYDYKSWSRMYN